MKALSYLLRKLIVGIVLLFRKLIHTETSKWILRFCDLVLALVLIAIFHGWYMGLDVSFVSDVIPALCALCAAAHGFYFWKSKVENCRKYPDIMECLKNGIDIMNDHTTGGV